MKINKYFAYLAMALPMLLLSSCLKDQEDKFDESASIRMQNYLNNAQSTLVNADYGWALDYYPDRSLSMGGFAYTVKFTEAEATVGCILDPGNEETSLYRMGTDDGPLISFDSYNTLMHFFATPSSSSYQGYDGDFEFVIDSVGTDVVKVHGKRTLNTMYFRKLTQASTDYIAKVAQMESDLYVTGAEGTIGDASVVATIDADYQNITFTWGSNEVSVPYCIIDTGIRFYEPITVGGKTFSELAFDGSTLIFTGQATDGTTFTLNGTLPDTYVKFADYAGTYWFKYNRTYYTKDSCRVTLTPSSDGSSYIMSGLNDNYTFTLKFNKSKGNLELNSQILGEYGGNYVWICAWGLDTAGGSLTWSTEAGMETTWNQDSENPVYTFGPNSYSGLIADSFIMWKTTTSGSNAGQFTGVPSWRINNNTYRLYLVKNLTKIN